MRTPEMLRNVYLNRQMWDFQAELPEDYSEMERMREWMKALLHSLYHTGNVEEVEHNLEELCYLMDLELPAGRLQVVPRPPSTFYTQSLFELGVGLSETLKEHSHE